jgi:predicted nucleic acid-binding protein
LGCCYLLAWDLGAGETQVIALGIQIGATRVVLDDLEARKCAKAFELNVIGTLGLVARAKHLGVIDRVRPVMEQLACSGMHVSPALLNSILAELGE